MVRRNWEWRVVRRGQCDAHPNRRLAHCSGGKLQLQLSFNEKSGSIEKSVLVRCWDGRQSARSISQLSGGEWRRVSLAFSLAFTELKRARLGLSCSYLVFDEAMQHMDLEGQAAMSSVLREQEFTTAIVIAHGLASDDLYGGFDSVDIVEKVRSAARRLRAEAASYINDISQPLLSCLIAQVKGSSKVRSNVEYRLQ